MKKAELSLPQNELTDLAFKIINGISDLPGGPGRVHDSLRSILYGGGHRMYNAGDLRYGCTLLFSRNGNLTDL